MDLAAAQLEQARSQVEQARKMLSDSIVHAPVGGEIQVKHVNEGGYVEPPTPLFSIVDNTRLELESMVATADLAPVRAGQGVAFTVNAYPDQRDYCYRQFRLGEVQRYPSTVADWYAVAQEIGCTPEAAR